MDRWCLWGNCCSYSSVVCFDYVRTCIFSSDIIINLYIYIYTYIQCTVSWAHMHNFGIKLKGVPLKYQMAPYMHRHNVSRWYWVYELALSAAGADEFGVERHICSLTSYTITDHQIRCSVWSDVLWVCCFFFRIVKAMLIMDSYASKVCITWVKLCNRSLRRTWLWM